MNTATKPSEYAVRAANLRLLDAYMSEDHQAFRQAVDAVVAGPHTAALLGYMTGGQIGLMVDAAGGDRKGAHHVIREELRDVEELEQL